MSSTLTVALADYFNVSINEMTGRVSANQVKYVGVVEVNQNKTAETDETDGKLDLPENLQELKK